MGIVALPTSTIDGIRLFDTGEVDEHYRTIVLLHGLGNSLNFWTAVAPLLAEHSRVIALDIPGFGGSSGSPGLTMDVRACSERILHVLVSLRVGAADLVGHSLGGIVALDMAIAGQPMVRGVVLLDGMLFRAAEMLRHPNSCFISPSLAVFLSAQFLGGLVPTGALIRWALGSAGLRRLTLWPFVAHPAALSKELVRIAFKDDRGGKAVLQVANTAHMMDLTHLAEAVPVPVGLIWGEKDHLINSYDVRLARQAFRDVKGERVIGDCGHWPLLEKPLDTAKHLRELTVSGD